MQLQPLSLHLEPFTCKLTCDVQTAHAGGVGPFLKELGLLPSRDNWLSISTWSSSFRIRSSATILNPEACSICALFHR